MAEAVAGRRRPRKRVLIKPDGRYLILYEPSTLDEKARVGPSAACV